MLLVAKVSSAKETEVAMLILKMSVVEAMAQDVTIVGSKMMFQKNLEPFKEVTVSELTVEIRTQE